MARQPHTVTGVASWAPARAVEVSLLVTAVVLGGWVVPAGAAKGGVITRNVKVLDASGHPFSAGIAGVAACPLDKLPCAPGSPDLIRAPADPNGNVAITVTAKVGYRFLGSLVCATSTTTSNPLDGLGAQLEAGTVFTVNAACGAYGFDVFVHYLDGTQAPLPAGHGGVLACSNASCVVGAPDAAGHATVALDPTVSYTISGMATNMPGWNCPSFVNGANTFWFSPSVSGTPIGATFVVDEPTCFTFNVLDGDGHPFAHAGIWAVPVGGGSMLFGTVDPNGVATFTNLDPSVVYSFTAFAINTGWGCGYVGPDGTTYNFSAPVQGYPAAVQGTTFTIAKPNC